MDDVLDLIREFDQTLEDSVGLYLDAQAAMIVYAADTLNRQKAFATAKSISIIQQDALAFSYGRGDPNDPSALHLHSTTQGELKARNDRNGKNHILLGQRFIVDVYAYWEDGYRSRIADALGVHRDTILADILGDIRLLRNSIIHHRGIATRDVQKCRIIKWFKEGDKISINADQFEIIIFEVRKWLELFGVERAGRSPELAGRWGPSGHRHIGPA